MNFTEPSELDVPNHGTKNRYKTILPSEHTPTHRKSEGGAMMAPPPLYNTQLNNGLSTEYNLFSSRLIKTLCN